MALAAVVAALIWSAPAQAASPGYVKSTYRVPVTQPDVAGNPVSLDVDVYLPSSPPPPAGYPLVEVFHGGGSSKDNGFDAEHAQRFAKRGYASLMYSQRGHGASDGQTTVAGPKEIRDLFDVTAWAVGTGGRKLPAHPRFHINRHWIALTGYSQGGLNTNLGQVHANDRARDPYGFTFRAIEPGNTPDFVFNALVTHRSVKLSFGVGLLETYLIGANGHIEPVVAKWIATAAADQPAAYGAGGQCDSKGHDVDGSSMLQDLAWRSVGCHPGRLALPWHWAQAFDDQLFAPDMAISMYRRAPHQERHRLYLSMGGHAAPSADRAVEEDKFRVQMRFMDAVRDGTRLPGPKVVYWTRDPKVAVPRDAYVYPATAWYRQTSSVWPPRAVSEVTYALSADGRAATSSPTTGSLPLAPLGADAARDPVAAAALSATPLGTSPVPGALPAANAPGLIAAFATAPFPSRMEMSGAPRARLAWTTLGQESQLALEVFDQAPDGTLTLLARGVHGIRGATPGASKRVTVKGNAFSALIRPGHRIVAWVMNANVGFYKPFPANLGGSLQAGTQSTLTLPLKPA